MLTVNEIFHSIQGESTYAGAPCVFVRLTACDLRCTWCDTPYAFTEGAEDDRRGRGRRGRRAIGCPLVEITGGEPLLQEDVYPLMAALLDRGQTVLLETGGHISVDRVPAGRREDHRRQVPGSGESARNDWPNLDLLGPADEVKFVIQDRADYEFARDVVSRHALAGDVRGRAVLAGARRARAAPTWPRGCSRTGCRCGCSCRCTSTSGGPRPAASEPLAAQERSSC